MATNSRNQIGDEPPSSPFWTLKQPEGKQQKPTKARQFFSSFGATINPTEDKVKKVLSEDLIEVLISPDPQQPGPSLVCSQDKNSAIISLSSSSESAKEEKSVE